MIHASPRRAPGALLGVLLLAAAAHAQPNDDFADATLVSAVPFVTTQSTAGASFEAEEPIPCVVSGVTVWYRLNGGGGTDRCDAGSGTNVVGGCES